LIHATNEQSFAYSSNAIRELGTNAVSVLLQIAETNVPTFDVMNYYPAPFLNALAGGNEFSLQVALGARVLGPLAKPLFSKLTNQAGGNDRDVHWVATSTLMNAGAAGIWELMRARSDSHIGLGPPFSGYFHQLIEMNPRHYIPIFIDIYQRGEPNMRKESRKLLSDVFCYDLNPGSDELIPFLQKQFQDSDGFLRSQILFHLGRCTNRPTLVLPVITKSLEDSDATVRTAATNALNAIKAAK